MPDELISGATDTQYVPTNPDDLGRYVYCRVRGDNAFGFSTANSNVIGPIAVASDLVNTDPPEITIASGGDSLTSDTGTWTGSPTITHGYLWFQADDAAGTGAVSIPLATSATYTIDGGTITPPATGSTWNPADATANMELSGGNLTAQTDDSAGFAWQGVRGTLSHANGSGKWYFEITLVDGGNFPASESLMDIGLVDATYVVSSGIIPGAADSKGFSYRINELGFAQAQAGAVAYPSSGYPAHVEGDVVGIACDMSGATPKVWIRNNGTWLGGDPIAGTGGLDIGATAGALFPYVIMQWQAVSPITVTLKTVATFAATPPTGFTAWG